MYYYDVILDLGMKKRELVFYILTELLTIDLSQEFMVYRF